MRIVTDVRTDLRVSASARVRCPSSRPRFPSSSRQTVHCYRQSSTSFLFFSSSMATPAGRLTDSLQFIARTHRSRLAASQRPWTRQTEAQSDRPAWLARRASLAIIRCVLAPCLTGAVCIRHTDRLFSALAIIPTGHDLPLAADQPATLPKAPLDEPYRIFFHVYKPITRFPKTAPPPPDYYIAIIKCVRC